MGQIFRVYSDIQAIIVTTTKVSKDELIVNVEGNSVHFDIQEEEESKGIAIIEKENVQKLFDWLKSKDVVR